MSPFARVLRRSVVVTFVAGVMAGLFMPVSVADHWSTTDARDNAAPQVDIVGLAVANGPVNLRSTVYFRDVRRPKLSAVLVYLNTRGPQNVVFAAGVVWKPQQQRWANVLWRYPLTEEEREQQTELGVPCRGMRREWVLRDDRRDHVKFTVPQACLGEDAGRVRASALAERRGDGAEDTVQTRRFWGFGPWIPRS